MRTRPPGLDDGDVQRAAADGWGLHGVRLRYLPVGFGSYHWLGEAATGRYFLTVDDLTAKPWLGSQPDTVFTGLLACYAAAHALASQGGLAAVIPPVLALDGAPAMRLTSRYALTVFRFTGGACKPWGSPITPADRGRVISVLAAMHMSTPAVGALPPVRGAGLPERAVLDAALADLGTPWDGGPFSEPARRELAAAAGAVATWLGSFDRLAARLAAGNADLVITHGEPHPGNVLWSGQRLRLIDWDTVALAPRERDLWMLDDGTPAAFTGYARATGRDADPDALRLYRLTWLLSDIAAFVGTFRSEHRADEDTSKEWRSLRLVLGGGPGSGGELEAGYLAPWRLTRRAGTLGRLLA